MAIKQVRFSLAITLMFVSLSLIGCAGPDEKANKLFVEASQLVKKGKDAELTDYGNALQMYNGALKKLENIIKKYPGSAIAVRLVQDEATIEGFKYTYMKNACIPLIEKKAEAEKDILSCALFVALTISEIGDKVRVLACLASGQAKRGEIEKAKSILSISMQIANNTKEKVDVVTERGLKERISDEDVWKIVFLRCAYKDIVDGYLEVGDYRTPLIMSLLQN